MLTVSAISSDCDPIITVKDLGNTKTVSGLTLDDGEPANPCGLVAKSFFNDTFALFDKSSTNITISDSGIAWDSDKEYKFKNMEGNWQDHQWIDVTNEHFIVWMRTAGLPNFRKLYGRLENGLKAGDYTMKINNNYDVSSFEGKKSFVLSTTNALGGKNYFLAICYIVVGSLCIVFSIIFCVAYIKKKGPKRQQD